MESSANQGDDTEMTHALPLGSIYEMSVQDQEKAGQLIVEAFRRHIGDHKNLPVNSVLDKVADDLLIRRNDMLFGLMYAEAKREIVIDHGDFTMSMNAEK